MDQHQIHNDEDKIEVYVDFLKVVSEGRNISTEDVDKLARGKVYYGNQGKNFDLIDIIGDFNDAIEIASILAEIDKYQIIEYPKEKSDFEKLKLVTSSFLLVIVSPS